MKLARAKQRRRRRDALGGLLMVLTAALLAVAGAFGLAFRPPPLDPETLCRQDARPPAATLVLIEASDAYEPRHRRRLRAAIEEEARRLPRHGRLTMISVRPEDPREPRVLFARCNPGDGRSVNPVFANPARAQALWEEGFHEPLRAALARAGGGRRQAAGSHIVEAMTAAVAEPDFAGPRRRFVLVSDLLQHTPAQGFTAYAEGATLERYTATHRGFEPPNLEGVEVRVVGLDRPDFAHRQNAVVEGLWAPLFEEAAAASVVFEGL